MSKEMTAEEFVTEFGNIPGVDILEEVNNFYPFKSEEEKKENHLGNPAGFSLYNHDGFREEAGFNITAKDCVIRAIAISCQVPYKETWDCIDGFQKEWTNEQRRKATRLNSELNSVSSKIRYRIPQHKSPDKGVFTEPAMNLMTCLGWKYYEYTQSDVVDHGVVRRLNTGESVEEFVKQNKGVRKRKRGRALEKLFLPEGNIILQLRAHWLACINHELYDNGAQCFSRKRTKLVKGFYYREPALISLPIEEVLGMNDKKEKVEAPVNKPKEKTKVTVNKPKSQRNTLVPDDIPVIRNRRANHDKLKAIADDYGVSVQCIRNVVLRKTWKHIP